MNGAPDPATPWWAAYLPLAILAIVVAIRWRRMDRARPLRPRMMLAAPVVYALLVIAMLVAMPPTALGWASFVGGLALGVLAGWQRARLMRLHVDPDHGRVMVRQSPAALLLLVALAVGRRLMLPHTVNVADDSGHIAPSLLYITDGLFGFALGMISATAIALWRRARVLLAAHLSEG